MGFCKSESVRAYSGEEKLIINEVIKIRSEYAKNRKAFASKDRCRQRKDCDIYKIRKQKISFGAIKGKVMDAVVLGKFEDGKSTSYDKMAQEYDAQYYNLDEWDELQNVF